MIRFKIRSEVQEQMDDADIGRDQIEKVLSDINTVNHLLGGNRITIKAVKKLLEEYPEKEFNILDVGCGDGTLLREVASFCQKKGIKANLRGIDLNGDSIALATRVNGGTQNITFVQRDVFSLVPDRDRCDLLLCTLTLHHFGEEEIPKLIEKFAGLARIGVVINDLDRNRVAYLLFSAFSALFMKTGIARSDGLLSIKKGFTRKDLKDYSMNVPQMKHRIRWCWAFRYEWTFWHPYPQSQ